MATHIIRGSDKEDAFNNLNDLLGDDVFIIREFTDQDNQYCIEAATKYNPKSIKENAIPQNVDRTNPPAKSEVELQEPPADSQVEQPKTIIRTQEDTKPKPSRPIGKPYNVSNLSREERQTMSQLLSNLRMAGFKEAALRQFVYWVKRQNDEDPNINRNQPKDAALPKFAEYLSEHKILDPLSDAPLKPVLLVGPPGSGKTVTAAKLSARALLAGEQTNFINLDCVRSGAKEQAVDLCNSLQVELDNIENVVQFDLWIDRFNRSLNQPVTIIDSLSTNIYDMEDMRWLVNYMEACEKNALEVEMVLVISATTDHTTIGDYVTTFKSMGVNRAILTCWDIASRPASTFSAIMDAGMKIAMISDSPYLAGGIDKLNPLEMAKMLTRKKGMPAWLEKIGKISDQ